jgi:hypothetical protein
LPDFCPLLDSQIRDGSGDGSPKTPTLSDVRIVTVTARSGVRYAKAVLKLIVAGIERRHARVVVHDREPTEVSRFSSAFGIDIEADQQRPI